MGWDPPTEEEARLLERSEPEPTFDSHPCVQVAYRAKEEGDTSRELGACLFAVQRRSATPYLYERAALLLEKEKSYERALAVCDLWFSLPKRPTAGTGERDLAHRKNRLLRKLGRAEVDLTDPRNATDFGKWVLLKAPHWTAGPEAEAEVKEAMDRFHTRLKDLQFTVVKLDAKIDGLRRRSQPSRSEEIANIQLAADVLWDVYVKLGGLRLRSLNDEVEIPRPWADLTDDAEKKPAE